MFDDFTVLTGIARKMTVKKAQCTLESKSQFCIDQLSDPLEKLLNFPESFFASIICR